MSTWGKWSVFRVTTIRRCASAVAAICESLIPTFLGIAAQFPFERGGVTPPLRSLGLIKADHPTSEVLPQESKVAFQLAAPFSFGQPLYSVSQFGQRDCRDGAFQFVRIEPSDDGGIRLRLTSSFTMLLSR